LAVIIAWQHLDIGNQNHLFGTLVRDLDPIARQSGALLKNLGSIYVQDPKRLHDRSNTQRPPRPPWYEDFEALRRIDDFTTRVLLTRVGTYAAYENFVDPDAADTALLNDPRIDTPIVLTAMLADRRRAAWDRLLGSPEVVGLEDASLRTLLDHHRFAWVLHVLLPLDAPRFPLWVDQPMQLEAIAALRQWYARNRALFVAD
jgi:hypothetical protein